MQIIRNLLPDDLFAALRQHSRVTKSVRTSTTSWHHDLVGWSSPILLFPIDGELLCHCHRELCQHFPADYRDIDRWQASIHLGGPMSYIPWHNDGTHVWNLTCYLNEAWRVEDAGYFLYEAEDGFRAILPARNLGLIYRTPLMHSVALSNLMAPLRESLQLFINDRGDR